MILARAHMKRHFIEDPDMDILCSRSFLKRLKLEEVENFNFTKFSGRSHQIFEAGPRVIESHTLSCQDISCISIEGSHQAVSDPCDMMHQKDRVLPTNRSAVVQKLILIRDQQDLSTKANLGTNFNSLNSTLRELHRQREDRRLSKKDNVTGNIGYSSSLRVPEQSSTIILSNFVSERAQHSPNKVSKQHKFRIDYESRMLIENQHDSSFEIGYEVWIERINRWFIVFVIKLYTINSVLESQPFCLFSVNRFLGRKVTEKINCLNGNDYQKKQNNPNSLAFRIT